MMLVIVVLHPSVVIIDNDPPSVDRLARRGAVFKNF